MGKRRKRRLRGRALGALAARASGLLEQVRGQEQQIARLNSQVTRAYDEATAEIVQRLAEDEGAKEKVMRYAMNETAEAIGRALGKEIGNRFMEHSAVFVQARKIGDHMLHMAHAGLTVDAYAPIYERPAIRLQFDIPPIRQSYHVVM